MKRGILSLSMTLLLAITPRLCAAKPPSLPLQLDETEEKSAKEEPTALEKAVSSLQQIGARVIFDAEGNPVELTLN